MNPGDIILIRFPQTDLQAGKLRPALILAIAPGPYADLLLAMISSRTYQSIPNFDEIIDSSDPDFGTTGLKANSVVRLGRLATVDSAVVNARLGQISPERLRQIRHRLSHWLKEI
ncbi:MAG TPA: type II toxin-antitoxin system PemK/MazF family toxin [Anaerolineae bacterium]|nr:type II toxin-antitoxin system PemK/MazF family toxin [Anaerolineae bacterium]HMR63679.1 type II toxin-antitoxin system PemK/MazF family toxin [Anaerolineae bacterium]